jgi:anaerobic magnesium-protoporphyrin IX monomethyl ester cyclase
MASFATAVRDERIGYELQPCLVDSSLFHPYLVGKKIERVLFVMVGGRQKWRSDVSPPLGLMYLSAALKQARPDIDTRIHNMKLDNTSGLALAELATDFAPDLIGLSVLSASSNVLPKAVFALKNALPDVPIVLGGPHASAVGLQAFNEAPFDFLVQGEGEEAIVQLVEALENGPTEFRDPFEFETSDEDPMFALLRDVEGLCFPSGRDLVKKPYARKIEDIEALPFPDWDAIDFSEYARNQSMAPIGFRRYANLMTSRGCPFRCIYCHDHLGKSFRARSPSLVVDEIEILYRKYKIKHFEIIDDIFNFNKKRTIEICREIKRRKLKIRIAFPNGLRGDLLDEEVIDALAEAGTHFISFAVETATPRLQKLVRKHNRLEILKKNIDYAVSRKIFSYGFFMIGFPTETREEMAATIEFACTSKLNAASFFIVTPFGGTELYHRLADQPDKRDVLFDDYDYDSGKANCSELPDAELMAIHRHAYRRFYLNPRRIWLFFRGVLANIDTLPGFLRMLLGRFPLILRKLIR